MKVHSRHIYTNTDTFQQSPSEDTTDRNVLVQGRKTWPKTTHNSCGHVLVRNFVPVTTFQSDLPTHWHTVGDSHILMYSPVHLPAFIIIIRLNAFSSQDADLSDENNNIFDFGHFTLRRYFISQLPKLASCLNYAWKLAYWCIDACGCILFVRG